MVPNSTPLNLVVTLQLTSREQAQMPRALHFQWDLTNSPDKLYLKTASLTRKL